MIAQERLAGKPELVDKMAELRKFVHDAARDGTSAHEVERGLFRRLLSLGHDLLGEFFVLQGSGDVGEQFALLGGEVLQRQPELHDRAYTTIFGEFTLRRTVYGAGAHWKLEAPLDARLQLPDSKFSHLLQSWDQLVATEQPYIQRPGAGTDLGGRKSQRSRRGHRELLSWVNRSPAVRRCVKEILARSHENTRGTGLQSLYFSVKTSPFSTSARTTKRLDERRAKKKRSANERTLTAGPGVTPPAPRSRGLR